MKRQYSEHKSFIYGPFGIGSLQNPQDPVSHGPAIYVVTVTKLVIIIYSAMPLSSNFKLYSWFCISFRIVATSAADSFGQVGNLMYGVVVSLCIRNSVLWNGHS